MPCDQVNVFQIDFSAGNLKALEAAAQHWWNNRGDNKKKMIITKSGSKVIIHLPDGRVLATLEGGTAEGPGYWQGHIKEIRLLYSHEIVKMACLQFGWQRVKVSDNKYKLTKGVGKVAEMALEILEHGVLKITTGNLQGEHHASADEFMKGVQQLAGGARETTSNKGHHHHHSHHHVEHKH